MFFYLSSHANVVDIRSVSVLHDVHHTVNVRPIDGTEQGRGGVYSGLIDLTTSLFDTTFYSIDTVRMASGGGYCHRRK